MLWYIAKLIILLPLIGAMIWGSLKLAQKMQARVGGPNGGRRVKIVETIMLSPMQKLVVIEFNGREILVAAGRQGLSRLAEAPAAGQGGMV